MAVEKEKITLKEWFTSGWLFKDVLQLLIIPITGAIVTIIINFYQNENTKEIANRQNQHAKEIAEKQNQLFALQMFEDKLSGDRVTREMTLRTIELIDDTIMSNRLREISDLAILKMLRDSIWDTSSTVKENAIIEYATLYKNKKYRYEILDALMPREEHLKNWDALISITKFFYYLTVFSNGKWDGTEKDLKQLLKIETSPEYRKAKNRYGEKNNIPTYFPYIKENFHLVDTSYKDMGLINLIWVNYQNDE